MYQDACSELIEKFRFRNAILCEKLYLAVVNESPINICHLENATSNLSLLNSLKSHKQRQHFQFSSWTVTQITVQDISALFFVLKATLHFYCFTLSVFVFIMVKAETDDDDVSSVVLKFMPGGGLGSASANLIRALG